MLELISFEFVKTGTIIIKYRSIENYRLHFIITLNNYKSKSPPVDFGLIFLSANRIDNIQNPVSTLPHSYRASLVTPSAREQLAPAARPFQFWL